MPSQIRMMLTKRGEFITQHLENLLVSDLRWSEGIEILAPGCWQTKEGIFAINKNGLQLDLYRNKTQE